MARINNLTNFLTDVATAIKTKTGDRTDIQASQFDTKIADITTGKLTNEQYENANDDLDSILSGLITRSGSFIANATTTAYTLDVGTTDWTYLLIVPHNYPYSTDNTGARCIGAKLVNRIGEWAISAYGSSSSSSTIVGEGSHRNNGTDLEINGSVITFSGQQAAVGRFIKDVQYDWFIW